MKLLTTSLCILALTISAESIAAGTTKKLKDENARISYSLGYQIGSDFKKQGVKVDAKSIIKGIEDATKGTKPLMDPQEMHTTLVELKRKITTEQAAKQHDADLVNMATDKKYMEEILKQPDIKKTADGLVYKILKEGNGKNPTATDTVTVNYRGTLSNGNEFDSSYKRGQPATFPLNGVIKGWTEGLQLIKVGGKIQLYIPPELAYGERGPLAHRTLIFEVELISIGEEKPKEK